MRASRESPKGDADAEMGTGVYAGRDAPPAADSVAASPVVLPCSMGMGEGNAMSALSTLSIRGRAETGVVG